MFQIIPPHKLKVSRCICLLVATLLHSMLASCGGSARQITSPPEETSQAGLPSLHELLEGGVRRTSLTLDTDPSLSGDAYWVSGGNVVLSEPASVQIFAPAGGMSYAIYQFSDLAVEDVLGSITVTSAAVDGGAEFEYYLLYSDFSRNAWKTVMRRQVPGERTALIENPGKSVSGMGTSYIAVLAYDSAALEVLRITAHFDFFGRLGIDHFESSLPGSDAVGETIRLNLQAVDAGGLPVTGFSQPLSISSLPLGISVTSQPVFQAGLATAEISFSSTGIYSIFLEDTGLLGGGILGPINVYESALPVYKIEIPEDSLASLNADPWSDEYFQADVSLAGQQFAGVRVRYRGGVTRNMPKKSWKVKLNTDNKYADPDWGYDNKTLNLNAEYSDPTLLRDKLCYDIFQDLDVLAPRARFIHMRVNGVFQGVYTQVEQPRTDWLTSLGIDPNGPLYEAKNSNLEELVLPSDYVALFDKELNDLEPFDDLAGFISGFNNWTPEELHSEFIANVEEANYLNYMLANTLVSQGDHIMKNYMLYLDVLGSGKWYIVAWDNDLTWGHHWSDELELLDLSPNYNTPIDYGSFSSPWSGGTWGNYLMDRWLNDPAFYAEYKSAISDSLDNYFTEDEFIGRVDAAYNLVLPDALADPQKFTDGIEYHVWVEELREYVRQRRAFLADAIL